MGTTSSCPSIRPASCCAPTTCCAVNPLRVVLPLPPWPLMPRAGFHLYLREEISMIRIVTLFSLAALLAGCSGQPSTPEASTSSGAAHAKRPLVHGHPPGQHGGVIVDIGADMYHAEPV